MRPAILPLIALSLPSLATAAPLRVGAWDNADHATIDEALAATDPAEPLELLLSPGTWDAVELDTGRAVLLRGVSAFDTRIEGAAVTHADGALTLQSMMVRGEVSAAPGTVGLGEVVFQRQQLDEAGPAVTVGAGGQLHASQVLVTGWTSPDGAVVVDGGGAAEVRETAFVGCSGGTAAAVHVVDGAFFGEDLDVLRGRSSAGPGLVLDAGSAVVRDLLVRDSLAQVGGAVAITGGTAYLSDLRLEDNEADQGAHLAVRGGVVDLKRVSMSGGQASAGGGFWMDGGSLTATNALFEQLSADDEGGAGWVEGGAATVVQATVHNTVAGSVGGFGAAGGTVAVHRSILTLVDGVALAESGAGEASLHDSLMWGILAGEPVSSGVDWEINGTVQDPRMRGAAAGDYTLLADSPGLDLGIGGETDPDGTAGDLGMYGGRHAWSLADADGDGFVDGRDCDDSDATINESADDQLYDGIDQDCDGRSDFDQDRDGFDAVEFGGTDCDDTDQLVFPGAVEDAVDGVDRDCDGEDAPDADGDGWVSTLDCDDSDPEVNPEAPEDWYDGVDQDCGGGSDFDRDGDGYESRGYGGTDCDDNNSAVHPGAVELDGDRVDQDCDGERDAQGIAPSAEDEVAASTEEQEVAPATDGAADDGDSTLAQTGGCSVAGAATGLAPLLLGVLGLARRRQ